MTLISFVHALLALAPVSTPADTDPTLRRLADDDPDQHLIVTVRVPHNHRAAAALRTSLAARGVTSRIGGRGPIRLGRLEVFEGSARDLARAAEAGAEVLLDPEVEPLAVGPLDPSGMASAAAHGPIPLAGPRGRGITIAAIDTGVDIYHPHFFQADGGAHPWIDLDGDGILTPGVDAIDLDLDGTASDDERLRLLDYGVRVALAFDEVDYIAPDGVLQPATDYLYVDLDGDGARGYGPAYLEDTPGWGEPMFVPDDADGDGTITLDERVLLLGTSKIAALSDGERELHRGVDLATWGRTTVDEEDHGTAVLGILIGGQDLLSRQHRGLVPDAEVVLFDRLAGTPIAAGVAWARDEGARVILHEYASYWGELDGSSTLDAVVDEATAQGLINVCGTGNAGAAQKHALGSAGDSPHVVAAEVPADYFGYAVEWLWLTTHWRDVDVALDCQLVTPENVTVPLTAGSTSSFDGGEVAFSFTNTSAGTRIARAELTASSDDLRGRWQLVCEHDATADTPVLSTVRDLASTGIASLLDGASPRATLGAPGTAAGCIVTGATHFDDGELEPGELTAYSSRGPRIDGARSVDLVSPGDPTTPYPSSDSKAVGLQPPLGQNNYRRFSGTSAAIPHVGAAIAALLEIEPGLTPTEVRERLRARAHVDDGVGDEDDWGMGRLDARALVYGEPASPPPAWVEAALTATFEATAQGCVARLTVTPDAGDEGTARWDDDYDGTWDTDFIDGATRTLAVDASTPDLAVRVELGRGGWRVGGAALTAVAPPSCFAEVGDETSTGADEAGGDSGSSGTPDTDGSSGAAQSGPADAGCGCTTPAGGSDGLLVTCVLLGGLASRRRRRLSRSFPASRAACGCCGRGTACAAAGSSA